MALSHAPEGYDEGDLEQHRRGVHAEASDADVRTPFQHDVDRILYSAEFRALAGKTQVVAADQLGGYHNRLTHSLKVAQIGRRLAVQLTSRPVRVRSGRTQTSSRRPACCTTSGIHRSVTSASTACASASTTSPARTPNPPNTPNCLIHVRTVSKATPRT